MNEQEMNYIVEEEVETQQEESNSNGVLISMLLLGGAAILGAVAHKYVVTPIWDNIKAQRESKKLIGIAQDAVEKAEELVNED